MGAPAPTFIPEPFANLVSSPNINFPIPDAPPSSPANAASWKEGFPSITMQPEVSGGLPPFGQDFNGILYTLSGHIYALQAGQPYLWNSGFVGNISGYQLGALLGMDDGSGLWLSAANGNVTNPDNDSTAAGWVPGVSYGVASLTGLTGGSVTVPPSKSRRPTLTLTGALSSNLTVILPNTLQQWLIVNKTTGAFSTTVKTAAGTGVVVAQGGAGQPTPVWGDGTNIYQATAPLSVPISIPATALTLLERDNLGQGYVVRLNQSSSSSENPTIGAVPVMNSALDGFLRFCSKVNFLSQIFASAALTGVPTAPTPTTGDNSTKIATTAFVTAATGGGSGSLGANGWWRFPSGLLLQWGSVAYNAVSNAVVNLTEPYTAGYSVVNTQPQSTSYGYPLNTVINSLSQFEIVADGMAPGTLYWFTIGK